MRLAAALLRLLVFALRALGPVRSSNLGGWIARSVGPWLPVSRVADHNLRRALPELDGPARAHVIRRVWDNLGRTVAELAHLSRLARSEAGPGWEVEGEAHVTDLARSGAQALFFSGHLGNWEMMLPIGSALGLAVSGIYRPASHPAVDTLIQSLRVEALAPGLRIFPKGARGAREVLAHLTAGHSLGLLADQKLNDGIAVPFFGRPAMTAPALAQFTLRFGAPIIPTHVVRLGPARFRVVFEPPLAVPRSGERTADIAAITQAVNATLERWIRADPGCWLWLHRRWPDEG